MNHKQRRRKLDQRRSHRAHGPSPIKVALAEVREKAKAQKKGESYVLTQMQNRGFLPDGKGGWRYMTAKERDMWK